MDLQKLLPELFPGIGKKEFFNGQIKPTQKAFVGPTFANKFDAIGDAAEGRFDGVGGNGYSCSILEPVLEKGGYGVRQVRDISSCFWVS